MGVSSRFLDVNRNVAGGFGEVEGVCGAEIVEMVCEGGGGGIFGKCFDKERGVF